LFLMPLWFLSGAIFAPQTAWVGLKWVMRVNPLSYGLAGLQRAVFGNVPSVAALPGWGLIVGVSVAFALLMFLLASFIARGRVAADLQ
jgi:ABC-2 type transport system permease protein